MTALLHRLDQAFLALLFPQDAQCLLCAAPSHGLTLCGDCASRLEALALSGPCCPRCGRPLTEAPCTRCRPEDPVLTRSALRHTGEAATLVHQLKFSALAAAAQPLANRMAACCASLSLPQGCVLTWVPMPDQRRRQRGIDHAECLAQSLGQRLQLPVRPLLRRTGETHTQRGLSGSERRQNLAHAFEALSPVTAPVLLVDDVLTTGATLQACGAVLRQAGCPAIFGITATQAMLS